MAIPLMLAQVDDIGAFILLRLVICVICGAIAAAIASSKGRNAVGWFFCGFFTGLIGIIIIACLSNRKEEQARERFVDQENRRLREQIRQEQIKSETFRQHAQTRLDAHDQKLGIDTRSVDNNLLEGSSPVAGLLDVAPVQAASNAGWYYAVNGQTFGPVNSARMMQMLGFQTIPRNSMVWTEGMADWATADTVPQFSTVVNT